MPGIAGLRAGIEFVEKKRVQKIMAHEHSLVDFAAGELVKRDGVRVFVSEYGYCQSGVLSFCVDKMDCEIVGEELARRNIAVRAGLHCAPLAHKTAGTFETGTVRVSLSVFNTKGHIRAFLDALDEILKKR
jgi:selenocysteine lyase/cysteine desulfurase